MSWVVARFLALHSFRAKIPLLSGKCFLAGRIERTAQAAWPALAPQKHMFHLARHALQNSSDRRLPANAEVAEQTQACGGKGCSEFVTPLAPPQSLPCCVGLGPMTLPALPRLIRSSLPKAQLLSNLAILILLQVSRKPNQAKPNKLKHHHRQAIQSLFYFVLFCFEVGGNSKGLIYHKAHINLPEEAACQEAVSKQAGAHRSHALKMLSQEQTHEAPVVNLTSPGPRPSALQSKRSDFAGLAAPWSRSRGFLGSGGFSIFAEP